MIVKDIKVYPEPIVLQLEENINKDKDEEEHFSLSVKCMFFWMRYKKILSCIGIILLIGVISLISAVTKSSKNENFPCINYTSQDLASTVSIECLRYLWKGNGCKGEIPDGYNGWWNRSPQGGKTVMCLYPNIGNLCGAGSFSTITTNFFVCDLNFKGFY